jgi:hypothetical protein
MRFIALLLLVGLSVNADVVTKPHQQSAEVYPWIAERIPADGCTWFKPTPLLSLESFNNLAALAATIDLRTQEPYGTAEAKDLTAFNRINPTIANKDLIHSLAGSFYELLTVEPEFKYHSGHCHYSTYTYSFLDSHALMSSMPSADGRDIRNSLIWNAGYVGIGNKEAVWGKILGDKTIPYAPSRSIARTFASKINALCDGREFLKIEGNTEFDVTSITEILTGKKKNVYKWDSYAIDSIPLLNLATIVSRYNVVWWYLDGLPIRQETTGKRAEITIDKDKILSAINAYIESHANIPQEEWTEELEIQNVISSTVTNIYEIEEKTSITSSFKMEVKDEYVRDGFTLMGNTISYSGAAMSRSQILQEGKLIETLTNFNGYGEANVYEFSFGLSGMFNIVQINGKNRYSKHYTKPSDISGFSWDDRDTWYNKVKSLRNDEGLCCLAMIRQRDRYASDISFYRMAGEYGQGKRMGLYEAEIYLNIGQYIEEEGWRVTSERKEEDPKFATSVKVNMRKYATDNSSLHGPYYYIDCPSSGYGTWAARWEDSSGVRYEETLPPEGYVTPSLPLEWENNFEEFSDVNAHTTFKVFPFGMVALPGFIMFE